ncbi:MAG: hypothetical protein AB1540_05840 [Bdellovibrionota bacterium]
MKKFILLGMLYLGLVTVGFAREKVVLTDPLLGGIAYSSQKMDPSRMALASEYLKPIFASELFDLIHPVPLEKLQARAKPEEREKVRANYLKEVSDELSRLFVLKSIAHILDAESDSAKLPKSRFDYALRKILLVDTQRLTGEKGLAGEGEQVLFEKLRRAAGRGPFEFSVRWKPGEGDLRLERLADDFDGALDYPEFRFSGRGKKLFPGVSSQERDLFPQSLEEFKSELFKRLKAAHLAYTRRNAANAMLISHWENHGLLNPFPPNEARLTVELFNPLGPARLHVTHKQLEQAYERLKNQIARNVTAEVTLLEVRLGDSKKVQVPQQSQTDLDSGSLALEVDARAKQCLIAFKEAFEAPYFEKQNQIDHQIKEERKGGSLRNEDLQRLVSELRRNIPRVAFEEAREEVMAVQSDGKKRFTCADFPMSIHEVKVTYDNWFKDYQTGLRKPLEEKGYEVLSEAQRLRIIAATRFLEDPSMQQQLIPYANSVDAYGNARHYFFVNATKPQQTYVSLQDRTVNLLVRQHLAMAELASLMARALESKISARYSLHARKETFSYNGVDGFWLKPAVAEAGKWIPQLFEGQSMQVFEQAYYLP